MKFVALLGLASFAQSAPTVPDSVALPALAHEISRWPTDHVACVDVQDRNSKKQFLSRIEGSGHVIVAKSECVWAVDGVTHANRPAFNVELSNFTRSSAVEVTVLWYASMPESGQETLLLTRKDNVWRVTGSLGRSVQ